MEPTEAYELHGYYDNVVFNNGLVHVDEDTVYLYYGGADKYVGGASFSIGQILDELAT
jgi:predicted GH43/DUF377 family glycosyl hydrolase